MRPEEISSHLRPRFRIRSVTAAAQSALDVPNFAGALPPEHGGIRCPWRQPVIFLTGLTHLAPPSPIQTAILNCLADMGGGSSSAPARSAMVRAILRTRW